MLKSIDEKDNIIYGDLSAQKNLNIEFCGRKNIVFFAGSSLNINIIFHGDNSLVFICNNCRLNGKIEIRTGGVFYAGENCTSGWTHFRVYEGRSIILGNDNMLSWSIWMQTSDYHLIFHSNSYKRINFAKSIYIGDHVWCAQEVAVLKGSFVASGSILGAKSVNAGYKFSNSIYAGNPSRIIKDNCFWSREDPVVGNWCKNEIAQYSTMNTKEFKFDFEEQKFLNPVLLEKELEKLENAHDKLEFIYDYIYNNTHKNRFSLFENSNQSKCKLYKDKNKISFSRLKFQNSKRQDELALKYKGAVCIVKNHLSYKLGFAIIKNSKNFRNYIKIPFVLLKIAKEHKNTIQNKVNLQDFCDYEEAINIKNSLSYQLGNALIRAHKIRYKGGYLKFFIETIKIIKKFKQDNHK
ncbi:acyltransferase [Campylobacter sp. RM16704]|uniref:acyltransferase n=1 Tax=Campylobacter sp. RM16704 TaxID=1500960 RepID=UPI000582327B|nr:hypothetical protein [Campylobacter sp. RM16704]AJC85913.1 putative protein, putative acetyltransferase [Campylobacter sp. RM16704]